MLASDPESRFGMQLGKAHPTCPLCKRQSTPTPTGALINTRLCKSCRTVVASAFRGASTYRPPQNPVIPEPVVSINEANHTLQEVDEVESVSNEFIEDSTLPMPSFEVETKPPLLFDEPHDRKFEFFEKDDSLLSNPPSASTFLVSENGSANGSSKLHREFSNPLARPTLLAERQPETQFFQAETPVLAETPVTLSPTPADLAAAQPRIVSEPVDAPVLNVSDYESSTDPWAAPLPAWDYSQSEWPVLVAGSKRKSAIPFRTAIAAVFLLFVVGFLYFMFNGFSTPDRPADSTTIARASAGSESRSTMTPVSADARKDATTPETKPTSSQPTEQVPHDAAAATDKGTASGHFSLQAASFPTERDADAFADKLKQAGVPS